MIKLFIDINVILEVLLDREFSYESDHLLSFSTNNNFSIFISALSYLNIHYQLKKYAENECRLLITMTKRHLKLLILQIVVLIKP